MPRRTSRALPEARGDGRVEPDGRRVAVRYRGWTTRDFSAHRTYAYDDLRPEPPVQPATMPAGVTGDPRQGGSSGIRGSSSPGESLWREPGRAGRSCADCHRRVGGA